MTALCIPAEADRGRDGWHVVWASDSTKPEFHWWNAREQLWSASDKMPMRPMWSAVQATNAGYRYGGPAPEAKEVKP